MYFFQSKVVLTFFRYHWRRGLIPTEDKAQNFARKVEELQLDNHLLNSIQATVKRVSQKFFLFRAIYWLFNISNYRENAYLCSAYHSHRLFHNHLNNFEGAYYQYALRVGGFHVKENDIQYLLEKELVFLLPYMKHFSQQITRLIGKDYDFPQHFLTYKPKEANPSDDDINAMRFKIDSKIHQELSLLGIDINQPFITFKDFKQSCKRAYLRTHPDKQRGLEEDFRKIHQARTTVTDFYKRNRWLVDASPAVIQAYFGSDKLPAVMYMCFLENINSKKLLEGLDREREKSREFRELVAMRREEQQQKEREEALKYDILVATAITHDIRQGLPPRRKCHLERYEEIKDAYFEQQRQKAPNYRKKIHFYDKKSRIISQFFKQHVLDNTSKEPSEEPTSPSPS